HAMTAMIALYEKRTDTLLPAWCVHQGEPIDLADDAQFAPWCAPVPVSAVKVWRILSKGSHYSWFSYDAQDEDAPPYALEWHRSMGHRSALGVPLTVGNEVLGFISLFFDHASPPPQERIELARVFGHQAVAALQLARLGEQAREAAVAREREQAAREREQAARDRAAALESGVLQRRRAEGGVRAHATLNTNAL